MTPRGYCVAIWILCVSLSRTAWAQPPERVTVPQHNPPEAVPVKPLTPEMVEAQQLRWVAHWAPAQIPEMVVGAFVEGDFSTAAMGVAGADWKSPELQQLQALLTSTGKRIDWHTRSNPDIPPPLPDAREITVKVRVGATDATELQVWGEETIVLRAETIKANKLWRIVAEKPETIFTNQGEDAPNIGLVRRLATYLAYPREAYRWLSVHRSLDQVKRLGLGVMQYTQDWDEHYPPAVATFREKIMPYIKDDSLFTSPYDATGHQSYNLNSYLAGHSLADLQEPAQTVAIYLGHDEKLDFRFDGRTVIGFADGHVKAVDAEEAKTLRWKP